MPTSSPEIAIDTDAEARFEALQRDLEALVGGLGEAGSASAARDLADQLAARVGEMGQRWEALKRRRAQQDQEQREAALQAETRHRALLGVLSDLIFRVDGEGMLLDFSSPAPSELDAAGERFRLEEVFPGALAGRVREAIDQARRSGRAQPIEYSLPQQGEPRDYEGQVVALEGDEALIVARDVTDRRRASRELAAQSEFIRQVLDHDPTLVRVSGPDGRVLLANQAYARAIGRPLDEVTGRGPGELPGGAGDAERQHEADQAVLRTGEPLSREEPWQGEGPEATWYQTHRVPLVTADGQRGVLAISYDITARRVLQESTVRAREAAEASNQEKSRFLANMSHELRTPLNGILGIAEMLLTTPLDDEQRQYAEILHLSGRTLLAQVNDVLDLSKLEAGKLLLEPAALSPAGAGQEVVLMMDLTAREKGIELRFEAEPGLPAGVRADPVRLRQVLLNLVGNAIKFTEAGSVVLRLRREPSSGQPQLRFEVEDTGIGIPASQRARLFRPFSQVDSSLARRQGGTGLGLVICQQLVTLMGGQIGFTSEPRRGSTFWFTLPVVEAAEGSGSEAPPSRPAASPQEPAGVPRRVLLVEDNVINQRVASRMIRSLGHQVDVVSDGHEALAALGRAPYDLVLLDLRMPGMDGLETMAAITERWGDRRPVVIALTADAMAGDRERCLEAGMDDYLTKPISLAVVRAAMERWQRRIGARQGG